MFIHQNTYPAFNPLRYIGIDSSLFDSVYAKQKSPNLCWAACVEMITRYYGLTIRQEEFAKNHCGVDVFGRPCDCAASVDVITENLNIDYITHSIETLVIHGTPDLTALFQLIEAKIPVVVAYNQGEYVSGHAVIITGMSYKKARTGDVVYSIVVRDPSPLPMNQFFSGRNEYDADDFLSRIYAWWVPIVTEHQTLRVA